MRVLVMKAKNLNTSETGDYIHIMRDKKTESPEDQRTYEDRLKMFRIWFTNVDTLTLDKNLEMKRLTD